jgi:hypothetical protein
MGVNVAAAASHPPPPSPTLHEALHELDHDEKAADDIKAASHPGDDDDAADRRRGSHSTASLKAAFKLPAKHDPVHKQPLPVETLGASDEKELTDADLDFPDGGLRAWSAHTLRL